MCALLLLLCTVFAAAPAQAQSSASAPEAPAADLAAPVHITRVFSRANVESRTLRLVTADGEPNLRALTELSLLARPHGVDRPEPAVLEEHRDHRSLVAPGIKRLDRGLLVRLARISAHFAGRRIDIVSGYRPRARRTSRHRHGRALDVRVVGVAKRRVVRFARTLANTGVGFYPNSLFTHIDVRDESHYWVDRSGPGEAADYGTWPPSQQEQRDARRTILATARGAVEGEAPPARSASTGDPNQESGREGRPAIEIETDEGTDTGTGTGTGTESDTGTGPGTESDTDTDTDTVTEADTDTDTVTEADTDTDTESPQSPEPPNETEDDLEEDEPPLTPEEIAALRERLRRDLEGLRD